jgi:serine/threonine protein kinase
LSLFGPNSVTCIFGGAAGICGAASVRSIAATKIATPDVTDTTNTKDGFADELAPGTTLLHGQYTIDSFLNAGGFGITYLARDSLDRKVVIKECFPGAFCRRSRYVVQARSRAHQNEFRSVVRLFVQEARNLSKLNHPNIVGVHQVFEDNDTAYMALDFVDGHDLLDVIEDPTRRLTPAQIKTCLIGLLDAVGCIHAQGILHRDISPDNILISNDMHPVLIDFGAAREEASKQSRVLSAMRVVKDGYSPQEFYIAGSDQSPSSDLYALAASFYHVISGVVAPNSQSRLAAIASGEPDPYPKLEGRIDGYDSAFLAAIDKALAILPKDRLQSAQDWLAMMGGQTVAQPAAAPASQTKSSQTPASQTPAASKRPVGLIAAGLVAVAVLGGVLAMNTGSAALPVLQPAPLVKMPDVTVSALAPASLAAHSALARPIPTEAGFGQVLPQMPSDLANQAPRLTAPVAAIAPAQDAAITGIVTEWTLDLPFAAAAAGTNIIGTVQDNAPDWLRSGLAITAVNDVAIADIGQIVPMLYASRDQTDNPANLVAQFDIQDPASGATARHALSLPVLRRFSLGNGVVFETRFADPDWRSIVIAAPQGESGGVRTGDIIASFIPTGETVTSPDSLFGILQKGQAMGLGQFTFAVQRDGSRWVATVAAPEQQN